jgi:hypothetical protein
VNISTLNVYTKNCHYKKASIIDYPSIRIGSVLTYLGHIRLFIVFVLNHELDAMTPVKNVSDILRLKRIRHDLKASVPIREVENFLKCYTKI